MVSSSSLVDGTLLGIPGRKYQWVHLLPQISSQGFFWLCHRIIRWHLPDIRLPPTGIRESICPRLPANLLFSIFRNQTTGKLVLEALDRAGVQPRVPVRSRNTETCVKLCMQGIGMCFTPETYMQNMEFSRKPVCFSVGEKGIFTTLSIAFRRGTYLPKYARDFIEIAQNK